MIHPVPSIDLSFKGMHDGGLYTGEEICAIFAEGEEVLAVLIEGDKEEEDSDEGSCSVETVPKSISDGTQSIVTIKAKTNPEVKTTENAIQKPLQPLSDETNTNAPSTPVKRLLMKSKLKRHFSTKMNQAAFRMKSAVRGSSKRMDSLESDHHSEADSTYYPCNNSHSSITGSTGDFSDMSFMSMHSWNSFDKSDQWAAAKRGDFWTLHALANDVNWTLEDSKGNVPLYYACRYGGSSGKAGLKSVKLLAELWPGPIPSYLLDRCEKDAANFAVKHILATESKLKKQNSEDDVELDGMSLINSVIGDDGYVEDY